MTLGEVQRQVLDPDALLLAYALGDERSLVWAVSADASTSYELPKRQDIERAARRFYEVAGKEGDGGAAAGLELTRLVLGPVAALLGSKRLAIVADGALEYVPFAA